MIYVVPGSPVAAPTNVPVDTAAKSPPPEQSSSAPRPASDGVGERWQMRTTDGRVWGPVSKQEFDQWYAEGRIPSNATLLREGDSQWRSATEVYPQLAGKRQKLNEQHNPFTESPGATPFHSASRPLYDQNVHRVQTSHRGGLLLTLAILGWVICPVFAPFAWAMGSSDLQAMRRGQMDTSGQSLTQAAMVLGAIETVLTGIAMFFMCLGGAVG